jgi:ribosome-binding factor A
VNDSGRIDLLERVARDAAARFRLRSRTAEIDRAEDMANPRTIARLEARIQERAAYCLQFEVHDPRASFITITRVELSTDVTSGKIFYSVLGSESDRSKAEHMLKSAAGFIQRQVARVLDVRRMPHLRWVYDGSVEHASNMDKLIREARERDREINPQRSADSAAASAMDGSLVSDGIAGEVSAAPSESDESDLETEPDEIESDDSSDER